MLKILFVGDKPSKKNTHPEIPFLGTASGKRLNRWMELVKLELNIPMTFYTMNSDQGIPFKREDYDVIIGLGDIASKRIKKAGITHVKFPHPSPRNRLWNDHTTESMYVDDLINKIARYAVIKMVREFFKGNEKKVDLWLTTKNLNFGNLAPIFVPPKVVLRFVKTQLEENKPS
jgi:uracil-DNA glycosylase